MAKGEERAPAVVEALAARLFPSGGAFAPGAREARVAEQVVAYVASMPRGKRLFFRAFLLGFECLPWLLGRFSRFSRLAPERQDRLLHALAASRFYPVRMAVLLLKSVFALAYYGDPAVQAALGYYLPCPPGGNRAPTTTPDGARSVL